MSERPFDRERLRAIGRLRQAEPLWEAFTALVARHGSRTPQLDAAVLLAGLHGLVALTLSGRASLGANDMHAAAPHLATRILPRRRRRIHR